MCVPRSIVFLSVFYRQLFEIVVFLRSGFFIPVAFVYLQDFLMLFLDGFQYRAEVFNGIQR